MTEWQNSINFDVAKQFSTVDIAFPTDDLIFKKLRQVAGGELEWKNPNGFRDSGIFMFLWGTLSAERDLAAIAYFTERKIPLSRVGLDSIDDDPAELIEILDESYRKLGISNSTAETKKLVENFQGYAREIAKRDSLKR